MKKEDKINFNGRDFDILTCSQPDAFGYIDDDRVLELMDLGYLKFNKRENWSNNGYKSTDKGIKLYKKWLKEMRLKHGHQWILNDYDGKPDSMAYCEGYHNGFKCKKCGFEFCHHCFNEWEIEECSKKSKGKSMSDDSKLDSGFVAMDKSIRNSYGLD